MSPRRCLLQADRHRRLPCCFLREAILLMAQKDPRTLSQRSITKYSPTQRRGILRRFWLPAVLLLALAAGGLTGIIAAYELNYSRAAAEVASLATYRPS